MFSSELQHSVKIKSRSLNPVGPLVLTFYGGTLPVLAWHIKKK